MDKQEVKIKRGLPEQDLKLKVKDDPYLADHHFTMVKEEVLIKSEAIENRELDVPFNNDKYMMIKEEVSETRHITLQGVKVNSGKSLGSKFGRIQCLHCNK